MEINLLNRSLSVGRSFGDDQSFISGGFDAWGGFMQTAPVCSRWQGKTEPRLLTTGSKIVCLSAADDWLNENETEETAFKTRQWLSSHLPQSKWQACRRKAG